MAAIEFAIVLPLLLFLFVGMIELTTALSYDRRVSKTGSSIADLVARSADVTETMDDIERAIDHQMTPYEDADVDVKIGMVLVIKKSPTIVWSWRNGQRNAWSQGSVPDGIKFSDTMLTNGQYYLISATSVEYNFILGELFSGLSKMLKKGNGEGEGALTSISLNDSFVLQPRQVSCVEYKGNCASYP
ncbi:TadE/TadG family type IV pilus assembly protein [Pseudovibrio sp. Tun.PSC04-5.I4]|uniref:TadE/TadG family type IV pilus assembly protein n=1 Tax=Pseudovibrio sp. Tun.PSC04-5.I4 TaxID=1798213 RepID=UPI0013565B59|nr:TadE/TadG family type IV pilus assembly protein [Pseudovibrio sp. Tun.PSC04-5.I4]